MASSIVHIKNYTAVLGEVYKRAASSICLNSPRLMTRAGRNAMEIMVPKIEVTGLGDYTRNVGYKTGSITYEFETKTFNYDRSIKLLADVMDVEEARLLRGGGLRAPAHAGGAGGRRLHVLRDSASDARLRACRRAVMLSNYTMGDVMENFSDAEKGRSPGCWRPSSSSATRTGGGACSSARTFRSRRPSRGTTGRR